MYNQSTQGIYIREVRGILCTRNKGLDRILASSKLVIWILEPGISWPKPLVDLLNGSDISLMIKMENYRTMYDMF